MEKNNTKTKVKKEKTLKVSSGQFYKASVNINNKSVTVELPSDIARYLDITENTIYWAAVNGVVQLSGSEPNIVIPMIGVRASSFVPQK